MEAGKQKAFDSPSEGGNQHQRQTGDSSNVAGVSSMWMHTQKIRPSLIKHDRIYSICTYYSLLVIFLSATFLLESKDYLWYSLQQKRSYYEILQNKNKVFSVYLICMCVCVRKTERKRIFSQKSLVNSYLQFSQKNVKWLKVIHLNVSGLNNSINSNVQYVVL